MTPSNPTGEQTPAPVFRRILLKLSGEALMGRQEFGIDDELLADLARHLKEVHDLGVEIAIVIGGGNIFRGVAGVKRGIDRVTGDHMGMLATVINALALMSALEAEGLEVRVQTAIDMHEVAEPFIQRRAIRHLEKQRVVLFAAGTGLPFFSTDTAAALRAAQIEADVLLMAKHGVDGVYEADPREDPDAKRFEELDYAELMTKQVMDDTATSLARGQEMPIQVFDFAQFDNLKRIVLGESVGTVVRKGAEPRTSDGSVAPAAGPLPPAQVRPGTTPAYLAQQSGRRGSRRRLASIITELAVKQPKHGGDDSSRAGEGESWVEPLPPDEPRGAGGAATPNDKDKEA